MQVYVYLNLFVPTIAITSRLTCDPSVYSVGKLFILDIPSSVGLPGPSVVECTLAVLAYLLYICKLSNYSK
jgi:hypothetical protein